MKETSDEKEYCVQCGPRIFRVKASFIEFNSDWVIFTHRGQIKFATHPDNISSIFLFEGGTV